MSKVYYTEFSGRRKYSNLTQKDRIELRDSRNRKKPLSKEARERIFGSKPVFIKTN